MITSANGGRAWRRISPALLVLLVLLLIGHGRLLLRVDHQAGDDDLEYSVPHAERVWGDLARDESPLWNPHSDLGTPLWTTGPYMGPFYPLFPLHALLSPGVAVNAGHLLHLLWAGLGVFLLLRRLQCPPSVSAAGGVALALSGTWFVLVNRGYLADAIACSHLPWIVLALEAGVARHRWLALLAGLPLGLALLGGNPVRSAIVLFTVLVFGLTRALTVPDHRGRAVGRFAVSAALGLGAALLLSAVQWLPAFADLTGAAGEERALRSATLPLSAAWRPLLYALPLAEPGAKGVGFVGVVPLLLAGIGLRLRRDPALLAGLLTALIGALAVVSPAIGLHDPLVRLIPVLGVFSYPYAFGLAVAFGLVVAGCRGAVLLLEAVERDPSAVAVAMRTVFVVVGLLLLCALPVYWITSGDELTGPLAEGTLLSQLWIWVVSFALAGLLWAVRRGRLAITRLGPALLVVVAGEMLLFAALATEPAGPSFSVARYFAGGEIARAIDADGRRGRVLLQQVYSRERDWAMRRNESLIRGFDAANLEAKLIAPHTRALSDRLRGASLVRREVIDAAEGGPDPRGLRRADLRIGPRADERNARLLGLAGVAYLVLDRDRVLRGGRFVPLAEDGTARLWVDRDPPPRARLVGEARVVSDDAIWDALLDPQHDPAQTVLLAPGAGELPASAPVQGATLGLESDRGGRVDYRVDAPGGALLVLSRAWHPAWRASVNDEPTRLRRADGCFMALALPPGSSEIRLEFAPPLLPAGLAISALSLLGLTGLGLLALRRG